MQEPGSTSPDDSLQVAIITAPRHSGGAISLAHDAQLVRSALLYADSVELISYGALMVSALQAAFEAGDEMLIEFLDGQSDQTLQSFGLNAEDVRTIIGRTTKDRRDRGGKYGKSIERKVRRNLANLIELLQERATTVDRRLDELAARSGAIELEQAIDAGLLKVSPRGESFDGDFTSQDGYIPTLTEFLTDPNVHLMFDEEMSALVRGLTKSGAVTPHPLTLTNASQAGAGTSFIRHRLPVFPEAPLDKILKVREDLSEYLAAYRAGVAEISKELTYAAYDREAEAELQQLWRSTVAPRIAELQRQLASTSLASETARNLLTEAKGLLAGGGAAGLAWLNMRAGDLHSIPRVLAEAAAGTTVAIGTAGIDAWNDSAARKAQAERDQMYYLVEMDRFGSA